MAAEQGFDASLKLRMASIIYVHTQRFYSELLAFFNHFHQHQNVMNRIREAAMGTTVNETASRGMKLRLDIEAESPRDPDIDTAAEAAEEAEGLSLMNTLSLFPRQAAIRPRRVPLHVR